MIGTVPLTKQYIKREKEIFQNATKQGAKNRTVPMPLYWKLLDAAQFAIDHGYLTQPTRDQ